MLSHDISTNSNVSLFSTGFANDGSLSLTATKERNDAACRRIKQRHVLTFDNSQSRQINPKRLRKYDDAKLLIRKLTLDAISRSRLGRHLPSCLQRIVSRSHSALMRRSGVSVAYRMNMTGSSSPVRNLGCIANSHTAT